MRSLWSVLLRLLRAGSLAFDETEHFQTDHQE